MSEIQVISGTRRSMREMADGTVRVQIDIDPRFRSQFFELFGKIDMPVALAPLVADFEQKEPVAEKPKGGALAKLAGMWCAEPEFAQWAQHEGWCDVNDADSAAAHVRTLCVISSRAELDSNPDAKRLFDERIRGPYSKFRAQRGLK